eukprot:CCRYP_011642-RA/>CCRYP_011642-RA protein AED:0.24 eAED:0.31 QI:657/0/0.5/1/0/0/2/0/260
MALNGNNIIQLYLAIEVLFIHVHVAHHFVSANPRTRLIALELLISRTSTATICTTVVSSDTRGAADSRLASSLNSTKSSLANSRASSSLSCLFPLPSSSLFIKSADCKTSTTALISFILLVLIGPFPPGNGRINPRDSSSMLLSPMLAMPSIASANSCTRGSLRNTPVLLVMNLRKRSIVFLDTLTLSSSLSLEGSYDLLAFSARTKRSRRRPDMGRKLLEDIRIRSTDQSEIWIHIQSKAFKNGKTADDDGNVRRDFKA